MCDTFRDTNKGWVCPKCGRVNAPWLDHCSCSQVAQVAPPYWYPWWGIYPPYEYKITYTATSTNSGEKVKS